MYVGVTLAVRQTNVSEGSGAHALSPIALPIGTPAPDNLLLDLDFFNSAVREIAEARS